MNDYQRAEEEFQARKAAALEERAFKQQKLELERESMLNPSSSKLPAPMQIANRMFELEKVYTNPQAQENERNEALRQYNLLGQAAKTYGFDRGVSAATMGDEAGGLMPQLQSMGGYDEIMRQRKAGEAGAAERAKLEEQLQLKPEIAAREVAAKSKATYQAEGEQSLAKVQRVIEQKLDQRENLGRVIENANQLANQAFTTGFTGSLASSIRGTPAFDLAEDVKTLRAFAAFDTLQQMRDNSPTGGALGQVSNIELGLLESAYSNLLTSQSRGQFLNNLRAFERQNKLALERAMRAYEQDYKRFGGERQSALPSPEQTRGAAMQRRQYNQDDIRAELKRRGLIIED
jgi:hypothetical protein